MPFLIRKYVPIDVEKIKDDECYRGFVNVFSTSRDSPDAILCCNPEGINPGICEPPVRGFKLYKIADFIADPTHTLSCIFFFSFAL